MDDWMTKGCEHCRTQVLSGGILPELAVSIEAHAIFRRCPQCFAFWIENEREAHVIDEQEARREFPEFAD